MNDSYAILGLDKNASLHEARAAYRRLAKIWHPDASGGDETRFLALNQAYQTLVRQPEKAISRRRGMISAFWRKAKTTPKTKPKVRGADIQARLQLSLKDMVCGASRRLTLAGGRVLEVECPPGCGAGDVIRLRGAGHEGKNGGKNGDALIRLQVGDTQGCTLKGRDIHLKLAIDLPRLRSGGKADLYAPQGLLKITVPPLAGPGTRLRLKGMGLPAQGKNKTPGDLYVRLICADTPGFGAALARFSRKWANPLRKSA